MHCAHDSRVLAGTLSLCRGLKNYQDSGLIQGLPLCGCLEGGSKSVQVITVIIDTEAAMVMTSIFLT